MNEKLIRKRERINPNKLFQLVSEGYAVNLHSDRSFTAIPDPLINRGEKAFHFSYIDREKQNDAFVILSLTKDDLL